MSDAEKYSTERITWIKAWTPKLFSFKLTRPKHYRFVPGQWARLGVRSTTDPSGTIWRAYSIVSADYDEELEFYSIVVPDGSFTSVLSTLNVGDEVLLDKQPYGFLTTDRFQGGKDLWMLSTGTGLAPFLSILHDPAVWDQYDQLLLVHCVREHTELAYANLIESFSKHELFKTFFAHNPNKLRYIPIVTRENTTPSLGLSKRITHCISDASLERIAGTTLDLDRSRIMLCGNPEMVDDTRSLLKSLGFTVSRSAKPGQIAVENYW